MMNADAEQVLAVAVRYCWVWGLAVVIGVVEWRARRRERIEGRGFPVETKTPARVRGRERG
jgi:hypothetical protein